MEIRTMTTVLVTGAAGFLGSHVTDVLVKRGLRPRAFVHPKDNTRLLATADVDIYRGDVCDRAAITPALAGVDCVINCAARTGPWGPAADYERTNVQGMADLVRASMAAGVQRFVHVSSITVHGNNVHGDADENSPLRTEPNPYSRSKVAGEKVLRRMMQEEDAPV